MPPSNREHWLATRRLELGLDQERIARRLMVKGFKVSRSAVSHWETGKSSPPLQNPVFRAALADVLQMTVSEMLRRAGYEIELPPLSEEALDLAVLADALNPLLRQDLYAVAMYMIRAQGKGKTRAMLRHNPRNEELNIHYIPTSEVPDAGTIAQDEHDADN